MSSSWPSSSTSNASVVCGEEEVSNLPNAFGRIDFFVFVWHSNCANGLMGSGRFAFDDQNNSSHSVDGRIAQRTFECALLGDGRVN